jgi:hypothetical protein
VRLGLVLLLVRRGDEATQPRAAQRGSVVVYASPAQPPEAQPVPSTWTRLVSWAKGLRSASGTSLDEETVRRLAAKDENENIEFKQRLLSYKEIAEYAVGIGNAGGGLLLMGITDKKPRKLVGLPELKQDDARKIQLSVHNSASIRVTPQLVTTQNSVFILGIEIPARPRGQVFCTQDGKYLMRVGENLVGIPQIEIRRMQAETDRGPAGRSPRLKRPGPLCSGRGPFRGGG